MTPERHARVGDIFAAAISIADPGAREAFLNEATAADPTLLPAVQQLLAHHLDSNTFLPTEAPPAPLPIRTLGPYTLHETLGQGGMGVVYRASSAQHPDVALKLVRGARDQEKILARFHSERRLLALLDHPHIARILDSGAGPDGSPYFVMERVAGLPLTDYCRTQQLSIAERVQLLALVCRAVHHAHERGVIHRDLKPANILVHAGVPKVIDFGLAKAIDSGVDFTSLTAMGTVLGTLQYMSPEQARAAKEGLDARTDVYALGILLYELLVGSPPLSTDFIRSHTYPAILERVLHESPAPPSSLVPHLPAALDRICAQALAKRNQDRFRSAAALARELEKCFPTMATAQPPRSWAASAKTYLAKLKSVFSLTNS